MRSNVLMRVAIQFLPWCKLEVPVRVGNVRFVPWKREAPSESKADVIHEVLRRTLAPYRERRVGEDGQLPSVRECTLVEYRGEILLVEPSEEVLVECQDAARMLTLAGLASRSLGGGLGAYCNTTNFIYFGHWLKDDIKYFATTLRRAAGHVLVGGHRFDETVITRPEHAPQDPVPIDTGLLDALSRARSTLPERQGSALWDALLLFNHANTDDTWFPPQLELIAMVGAMERVMASKDKAIGFAQKFEALLVPSSPVPPEECSRTKSVAAEKPLSSVRGAWAREVYRLRGDPAHGRLASGQQRSWDDFQHLALLRLAFPLVVKSVLVSAGVYEWTARDRAQINAFEVWACDPAPFEQPEDATWGPQSRLDRAIAEAHDEDRWNELWAEFEREHGLDQPDSATPERGESGEEE